MKVIHFDKIPDFFLLIIPYILQTLEMVLLSLVFGTIVAVFVAWMKLGRNTLLKKIAYAYTTIMRCVPSIVLLFLVYYGVIFFVRARFGIQFSGEHKLAYVVVTFTLFQGANVSEIMRSAYEAVDKGQMEAGLSFGLTPFQTFYRIVFPQAVRYAMPNIGNNIIYLFREGALAYNIGFIDMMGKGMNLKSTYVGYDMEVYIALAAIYWPLAIILEQIFKRIEKYLGRTNGAEKMQTVSAKGK